MDVSKPTSFEEMMGWVLCGKRAPDPQKLAAPKTPSYREQFAAILDAQTQNPAGDGKEERKMQRKNRRRHHEELPPVMLDPTSSAFRVDLIVSRAPLCYLMPTVHYPVARDHCWIVAIDCDSRCTVDLEDPILEDVLNYKKALVRMNSRRKLRTLFFETAIRLDSHDRRALVEAIPVPERVFQKAKLVFKKEMIDAGSDWSAVSTTGKKVLETSRSKPLTHVLPRGDFPYFHVEFEMEGGFVHMIEDESAFPEDFGRGVVVGLLGLDPSLATVSSTPSHSSQQKRAMELKSRFAKHDWTHLIPAEARVDTHNSTLENDQAAVWEEARDEKSGRIYYWHSITRETTWKRPKVLVKSTAMGGSRRIPRSVDSLKEHMAMKNDLAALKEDLKKSI